MIAPGRIFRPPVLALLIGAIGCGASHDTEEGPPGRAESATGTAAYGASYVSQSFPLATTTLTMKAGQVIPSFIELKNSGTQAWDTNTKIGTTKPRDRASAFADTTWLSPSRASAVTGTVAPGGTFKFTFDLKAPTKLGTYEEYFGVVEEGVAWFGDPNQGGPVDSDLEVKVEVIAADPVPDAGDPTNDDGGADDGGPIALGTIPVGGSDAGATRPAPSSDDGSTAASSSGCDVTASRSGSKSSLFVILGVALCALRRRRRRR